MRRPILSRSMLMQGASVLCLTLLGATAAHAQSVAALRSALRLPDLPANALPKPGAAADLGSVSLVRDQGSALARQLATQMRLANTTALVAQAQTAARAAAAALAQTVPNGLIAGGLAPANNLTVASQDPTGLHTWQGALLPAQHVDGAATTVTITQTDSRALLSWQTFNVGRDTTVNFVQRSGGVVQPDWVAFNRVVGQYDPATGRRDPTLAPAPSQILGHVNADASVIVINPNGVMFGGTSQVRAGSLYVSTLEIGHQIASTAGNGQQTPSTLADRNDRYLRLGVLGAADQVSSSRDGTRETFSALALPTNFTTVVEPLIEGDIRVDAGADLAVGEVGALLLAAPHVVNAGVLTGSDGQLSLAAGRSVTLLRSSGTADGGNNPDVRGLIVNTGTDLPSAYVLNTGVIDSVRGYLSISAGTGAIVQQGLLEATTSVSRNGFIDLIADDIRLAPGSTIAITPDANGETIPQSPGSVAAFKTSRVRIGGFGNGGTIAPARIEIDSGSLLYAPGGRVAVGSAVGGASASSASRVFIDTGATIDVGGVTDFEVPASRNTVVISPAKRNELRDTPNYRDSFLNGATIYVDPRRSGVRADGVAWVGSPLIEAGSFFQQVGVTSGELLTKGGSVTLGAANFNEFVGNGRNDPTLAPDVIVKAGATIDISGGWVRYAAGQVRTSQLVTASGQIVDIGDADPNGDYVGLVNPFTTTNTRFGITTAFPDATLLGVTQAAAYTEGRDAGALVISSPAVALDGTVYAAAYAGSLQRGSAARGTGTSIIAGDLRPVQASPSQLPAGGLLAINPVSGGAVPGSGDILITQGPAITPVASTLAFGQSVSIGADGSLVRPMRDIASLLAPERRDTIELAATTLSDMGLGQLALGTTGSLTLAAGTLTTLAPGGVFTAVAGRVISIDGTVSAPSGRIDLTTFSAGGAQLSDATIEGGSVFRADPAGAGSFDVVVNGTLSTRGRFVNDYGLAPEQADGGGYTNGGRIAIFVAPRVSTLVGAPTGEATDISGSILVNPGALIDVSSGARVTINGTVTTSARGGDVSLYDETTYAQIDNSGYFNPGSPGSIRGLRFSLYSPLPADFTGGAVLQSPDSYMPINPGTINARVAIADGSIRGQGFAGGGTFTLSTPSFGFGDGVAPTGTLLPLDFIARSGFGSYTINTLKTALTPNRFVNSLGGVNALLETQTVTIGAGQTLALTQSRYSPYLSSGQTLALRAMATGSALDPVVAAAVPVAAYDQLPVALTLGGLIELDVAQGGGVEGAPASSITASKLLDEGTIRLPGGTITATERLPSIYLVTPGQTGSAIGVHALSEAFTTRSEGSIVETDPNALEVLSVAQQILSNRDLALLHPIYLLGRLNQNEGIRIAGGATVDLAGISLRDPRATTPAGAPIVDGRLLDGGTLQSSPRVEILGPIFQSRIDSALSGFTSTTVAGQALNALPGSVIDISGASDSYARLTAQGLYQPTSQWSNGGRLALEGGIVGGPGAGSIAGATIRAAGGDVHAQGGTLVARDPVLAQSDPAGRPTNVIAADQVASAGFATFVAEGSLGTAGNVTLALGRAILLQSIPYDNASQNEGDYAVRIGATGTLDLSAPIIRLASIAQVVPDILLGTPGGAAVTLRANALDVQGAVLFDRSIGQVRLQAAQDLRLVGSQPFFTTVGNTGQNVAATLQGQLVASGDLTLAAGQVYPTTGTNFTVTSSATTGTITFARTTTETLATPYSAGANLIVQAANIEQSGVLRVPLGTLALGGNAPLLSATGQTLAPATASLHLAGSSITAVSADGLSIPYGTTTDQVEYFFTPTIAAELTAPPAAILRLSGAKVALDTGANVDLKGGGDVYAYEFVPGIGGSRDVLDRINQDPFSSTTGLQYPDGRQVYAIVPGLRNAGLAPIDPIYSGDYGALASASQLGRTVYLNAAPGLAAGWYTLLPARYALLPGGLRVVEQPEYGTPVPGQSTQLRDGTEIVGGYYGVAGTGLRDSTLRTFAVQTQTTFKHESQTATTSANTTFPGRAARNGLASPRIPLDAGRLIINAITGITADATFQTDPAAGGRASTADIAGTNFNIVGTAPATPTEGVITVTAGTLAKLNAASLLIGATRTDNSDGTTTLDITGSTIRVANDATTALTAPELLFAVDGPGSSITFAGGASVAATGASGDTRTGAYRIAGSAAGQTGAGAFVRLSTGPERQVDRSNVQVGAGPAPLLNVGLATLAANSLLLDSSGDLTIASPGTGKAAIAAKYLNIGAGAVAFAGETQASGLTITPQLQAAFTGASSLTLRSREGIAFSSGSYGFGALTLDTPVLDFLAGGTGPVAISTGDLRLANSVTQVATCAPDCGTGALSIVSSSISFGSGQVRAHGFGGGIAIAAPGGITFDGTDNSNAAGDNGAAGLDAGSAPLGIATSFLGDRAVALPPGRSAVLPRLSLATTGALSLTSVAGATAPTVAGTPGARLSLTGSDVRITDTHVRATAGTLAVEAVGGITLAGTASLATPGYAKIFGDAADPTTVSAPGGLLTLKAGTGGIDLGQAATLSVGGGLGRSGELRLTAANGIVNAAGTIDAKTAEGGGVFVLVSHGTFDVGHFAAVSAAGFDRSIDIRSGVGDLMLAQGETLVAQEVRLTADGGAVGVAGTIDTSGIDGGGIALYGANGVTLAPTGRLLARAGGYGANDSRQAKGGDVMIGTDGAGAITLAQGSVIDVSATRPGDRLVTDLRNGTTYYRLAIGDQGGTLAIRAPLIERTGGNTLNAAASGTVVGARAVTVEAFKRFDLAAVANDPAFTGVTDDGTTASLDVGATAAGRANFLADLAPGTIPDFVQNFDLTTAAPKLAGLGRYHARPGIELDYAGGITLAAIDPATGLAGPVAWNLGAGTVDIAGALRAGDMAASPVTGAFYVVPGREADLFRNFTRLTYRVGGRVDGEPGVLSIRAGGTLDIKGGISDGFFAFRDQTTSDAISYAYGGGARAYRPALMPNCLGDGDCSTVAAFDPKQSFSPYNAISIDFSAPLSNGTEIVIPPAYNPAANTPSAQGGGTGDPLGTAQVFPLLTTATGSHAVESWSYRLVGGADLAGSAGRPSVDPVAVKPGAGGGVIVEGETSYAVAPTLGVSAFVGGLLVQNDIGFGAPVPTTPANFAADFIAQRAAYAGVTVAPNAATVLSLSGPNGPGDIASQFLASSATAFFAGHPGQSQLALGGFAPSVTTTLALAGQFLQSIAADYSALIVSGAAGYTAPQPTTPVARPVFATNYVRTRVRTGTGSISISAAGNIDTTNGPAISRVSGQGSILQVGGTAIYTAGTPAALGARSAAGPLGMGQFAVDPSAHTGFASVFANTDPTTSPFQPLADALAADPVYLAGGGDVALMAGGDVLGRRDVAGGFRFDPSQNGGVRNIIARAIGPSDQPYSLAQIGLDTEIRVNPQLFQTGVGTLGGGTIVVRSGRDISDLTVVSNTSVATADVTGGGMRPTLALLTTGGGDVRLSAGRDLVSGLVDVGTGALSANVVRDVASTGTVNFVGGTPLSNAFRVRVADSTAHFDVGGGLRVRSITALGDTGFYTPVAAFTAAANGLITLEDYGQEVSAAQQGVIARQAVLPGTLELASLTSDLDLSPNLTTNVATVLSPNNGFQLFLSPSPVGQLRLFAGADIRPVAVAMDDGDPGILPGYFSTFSTGGQSQGGSGRLPAFPTVLSSTSDSDRRALHNANPTHAGDPTPVRVAAGGDIDTLRLSTPKQTRVYAGRDVLNSAVFAQNLNATDISRVAAGRDLVATNAIGQAGLNATGAALPFLQGNQFVIGGPGALFVEAGRDAGPFLTSVTYNANADSGLFGNQATLGGGVLSVGNEWNPWLRSVGANLVVQFGVGKGVNYAGLRDSYVDPANVTNLQDDLFAQVMDQFGRLRPDRSKPTYAPILVAWTQANASAELTAAYGTTDVTPTQAFAVFKALPELRQREFLIENVYFNELRQTSIPTSVSYLKYSRGYRAVNTLFPSSYGYTANDLSGGGGTGTTPVETGNLDLRLATIQTSRGGNIDILGPGGRVLGGSTVRTSAQAERRLTIAERVYDGLPTNGAARAFGQSNDPFVAPYINTIQSIPTGFEGVITLRGGAVDGFVDQNFLLNQSRLFTQAGGDIALWSSNGDLNAGQGPKSSANFPPVVVRIGPNATSEVDAVVGVTGAGIAAFQPAPGVAAPDVFLIAPRGTVDAGDAGVRVAGNLFVAALAVANADNFKVGGSAFGIPSGPVVNVAAAAAGNAATAAAQQAANAASNTTNRRQIDPLSRIIVDVLGYYGSSNPCDQLPRPTNCPTPPR